MSSIGLTLALVWLLPAQESTTLTQEAEAAIQPVVAGPARANNPAVAATQGDTSKWSIETQIKDLADFVL